MVDDPPDGPDAPDQPLRGRPQRRDSPKLYSEEEFNARIAEVLRERDRQATTNELMAGQAKLGERIRQMTDEVNTAIRQLREEVITRQSELQRRHDEVAADIAERAAQFRLVDLGPFEAGKFPDLLRWWARNEPIMTLLVARAVAESAVEDKEHSERSKRYYQTAIYASVATVAATVVTLVEWFLIHRP